MSVATQKFRREWKAKKPLPRVFMIGGSISLVLAVVGIFLPVIPQIPFAILAAYLFSKGSRRWHQWVRKNKHFGPPVRLWEDCRSVSPKTKLVSVLFMMGGAAIGHWKLASFWPWILDLAFVACIIFIVTRKTAKRCA